MTDLTKLSTDQLRERVAEVVKLRDAAGGQKFYVCAHPVADCDVVFVEAHSVTPLAKFIEAAHPTTDLLQELARRLDASERDSQVLQLMLKSDAEILAECPDPNAVHERIKAAVERAIKRVKANDTLKGNMAPAAIAHAGAQKDGTP